MKTTPNGIGSVLARSLLRATVIALYLMVAFAIAPALSTGAEIGDPAAQGPMLHGILAALALMLVTIGTALARWFREEPPPSSHLVPGVDAHEPDEVATGVQGAEAGGHHFRSMSVRECMKRGSVPPWSRSQIPKTIHRVRAIRPQSPFDSGREKA